MIGFWSSECECAMFLVKDKRFGICMMIRLDDMFILDFGDACGVVVEATMHVKE